MPDPGEMINGAMQAGYRFMSVRPRSKQEVRRRLKRSFEPHIVEQALTRLEGQGYLDDTAFARLWRESREAHRPRSAALMVRELVEKGVSREVAQEAVKDLDDKANAYRAAQRRLRSLQGLDYVAFRRSLAGYLGRRGFSPTVINCTMARCRKSS